MSLSHEYTDNFFIGESSILDAHLRLLFRAYHYETPCITCEMIMQGNHRINLDFIKERNGTDLQVLRLEKVLGFRISLG